MGIADDDIAKVRQSADIVKVVTEHVALRKVGRRWVGLCPFHNERTGSFSVNAEEGLYHCFGCKASGDTITFVREVEGLDFVSAVEKLAAMSGIALHYDNQQQGERRSRNKRLTEAIEKAVDFYHERLLSAPDAGRARAYLKSRGYDGETVRKYRLGWAPDEWDALARHLGLSDRDLKDAGLGFVNRRQRQQDFFRARVLFPIFDVQGAAIAFGGRKLPDDEGPKYRNTSDDCVVYDKSRTLYGLHWAKSGMVKAGDDGEAIICEGYTDVHGFAAVGYERAVATCGTSLTEEHIKVLTRFAHRLVLAFDADEAGQAAAERIHQWETQYELDVAVADLPGGSDPGDLARSDPDGLRRAVDEAKPFLQFRVDRVLGGGDLSTAEGRARAARAAVAVVRGHPDPLVRDPYEMQIADRCRVDVDRLRQMAATADAGDQAPAPAPDGPRQVRRHRDTAEDEALRLFIHDPDQLDGRLHPVLFSDDRHRAAVIALAEADSVHDALAVLDPDLGDFIRSMAVGDVDAEGEDLLARLVDLACHRMLDRLQAEARTADDPGSYAEPVAWLKHRMEDLRERDTRSKAIDALLPWLIEHTEGRPDA
ncbi:MAG: DNA primase [Acidimicrobiia bacterium]|nr:DNA primase [Acidimicrobiia bacterium]